MHAIETVIALNESREEREARIARLVRGPLEGRAPNAKAILNAAPEPLTASQG